MSVFLVIGFMGLTQAKAFTVDLGLFYLTDALSASTDTTSAKTIYDLAVYLDLTKKGQYILGWRYGSYSTVDSTGTEVTYSLTDMGPSFGYYFDKSKNWVILLTYNIVVNGALKTGATDVTWRGSSIKAQAGYTVPFTESLNLGAHLNYHSSTFNEQLSGTTTFSTVSYTKVLIYPSFQMSYRF